MRCVFFWKLFAMVVFVLQRSGLTCPICCASPCERTRAKLGIALLVRCSGKVSITKQAEKILVAAEKMDAASFELLQLREQIRQEPAGEVRLSITEGLGTFWVMPQLMDFRRANPNIFIDVNCTMKLVDVMRLEADVVIANHATDRARFACHKTWPASLHVFCVTGLFGDFW